MLCLRQTCGFESAEKSFVSFHVLGSDFIDGKYH